MSNCSHLPYWLSFLQALSQGVLQPLIVPLFAALGVWIAARQMLIAHEKLTLDSFDRQYDRRVAVYEATRGLLEKVYRGKMTEADTRVYGLRALDAQFLFDSVMYKYLRDLHFHVEAWRDAAHTYESNISNDERAAYAEIIDRESTWIIAQGDEHTGIGAKFAPFLTYTRPVRPWLLRWP